jgi:cysteinyl-tRNA synthetase
LFDAVRRVLQEVFQKQVIYAMNITDIDDKIINKCKATNTPRHVLTRKYEEEFFRDMTQLGVERPTIVPRATEHISEMVDFIGKLCKLGYAYNTSDGSVYLDATKANEVVGYPGKLGGGRQINEDNGEPVNSGKKHIADFALWKGIIANDESITDVWDAKPWGGLGRPGWHLECSAMVDATLGKLTGDGTIDIHGGGVDLCFPHHANERCQSQLILAGKNNSKEWATIFCHTGHVTVSNTKMSKSLGNFITIQELLKSGETTPRQLRLLFLSASKYASGLEWNTGSLERVRALDAQLEGAMNPSKRSQTSGEVRDVFSADDIQFVQALEGYRESIELAFADDFDFPKVFEELQKLCKDIARRSNMVNVCAGLDNQARAFLGRILETMGFGGATGVQPAYYASSSSTTLSETNSVNQLSAVLDELVNFRATVRIAARAGDTKSILQACDALRQQNPFIVIQDLKDGSSVWKMRPK